jgi:hypothetical protein
VRQWLSGESLTGRAYFLRGKLTRLDVSLPWKHAKIQESPYVFVPPVKLKIAILLPFWEGGGGLHVPVLNTGL